MELKDSELQRRIETFTFWVFKFQEKLGLFHICINVAETEDESCRACWFGTWSGNNYSILYEKTWIRKQELTDRDIALTAFHEVYELTFHEIRSRLAVEYNDDTIDHVTHEHVRHMENLLFPVLYNESKDG